MNSAILKIGPKFVVLEVGVLTPFGGRATRIDIDNGMVQVFLDTQMAVVQMPLHLLVAASERESLRETAHKFAVGNYGDENAYYDE